jgi:hypothetical protein
VGDSGDLGAVRLDVQLGAGKARMTMTNLSLLDYFSIPNALFHFQDPVAAVCSFDIRWSGPVTDRSPVVAPAGSEGDLVLSSATMTWSASNDLGFSFESDPTPTSSIFAQLGRVRNGVFAD